MGAVVWAMFALLYLAMMGALYWAGVAYAPAVALIVTMLLFILAAKAVR